MLSTVDELGTGRLRLPLSYITANGTTYGQPVIAECEFDGVKHRRGSQLLLSVKPVTSKVVTATAIKVLVPEQLLGSPVASAHLQQRLLQQRCTVHLSASVSCQHAAAAAELGVVWPRGLLLHGPPGCGKTLLVKAVAEEFNAVLHSVTPGSVFGAYLGESERRLREVFEAAAADAAAGRLVVVFLDEVDALCPRRGGGGQHEARVVAQLLTLLDGAAALETAAAAGSAAGGGGAAAGRVVVVAATNRPNALDPALRRPGRLDREVAISVPDAAARAQILRLHCSGLCLAPDVDLPALAAACAGYSGADLAALAREAAMAGFSEAAAALMAGGAANAPGTAAGAAAAAAGDGLVTAAHFAAAMHRVGPSIVRGAAVEVAPVGWAQVGGYTKVKQRLQQAVEWPLQHADVFKRLGLSPPRGVLLHGPPGCSKTMLARAAATGSKATFISLSCAQLYGMYVGEGEAALRDAFRRARLARPAIIFLDEADALAPRRQEGGSDEGSAGGPDAGLRLLSTLLTEVDGLQDSQGVLLLAATNRPAGLDPALLRPGRLDVLLYVPPPDAAGREAILRLHTGAMPLAADVDLAGLAAASHGFTGAELAGLCREAAMSALREDLTGAQNVANRHFLAAQASTRPALTAAELANHSSKVRSPSASYRGKAPSKPLPRCCCGSSLASGLTVARLAVKRMQPVVARFKGGDKEAGSEPAEEPQQQQQQQQEASETATTDAMEQQREPACEVCDAAAGLAHGGVPVVFELGKHCAFGNSFAITGEAPGLGAWDPAHAARMEWSEGDVWRVSVPLPIDSPIAFKYIELGPDGGLVGWGQDLCAGSGNMSVLVERAQDFVTGFTVTLDPPMPTASDVAVDAADPSPATQPYLAARLDIAAVLPLSSAFFQRKALAVAAGLPSTKADDLVTDAALAEQGLLSQRQLADKWGQQGLELLGMEIIEDEGGSSRLDGTSALAGAAAAAAGGAAAGRGDGEAGGLAGGYADAGSLGAAVAGGLMEAGDDETAAGGGMASSAEAVRPAAGGMMTSVDYIESGASSAAEDGSSSKFDTSADDEGDWVPPGPPTPAAAAQSTTAGGSSSSSSSGSGQQGAMGGLTIKPMQPPGSPQPPYVVCKPPPAGSTKLVSAGPSAASIDVDVPLNHAGRAVTEVPAGGELQAMDRLGGAAAEDEGDQPTKQPGSTAAAEQQQPAAAGRRVKVTTDQGMSVSMRGEDPLSLPDAPEVAAMRGAQGGQGFVDSETALGPDKGLLVRPGATAAAAGNSSGSSSKPRVKSTADQGMSVSMRGEDPLSLPDAPEVAAMRGAESPAGFVDSGEALQPDEGLLVPADLAEPPGTAAAAAAAAGGGGTADVQTPAGAKHEAEGFRSHEVLLAPAEQAQAAGLAAQAEGLDEPAATMSVDDERLAGALAAAAAAAAASVRYAGGAAAAEVQEAAEAVDARNALLQGPGAEPVQQIMAEAQGIADAARSGAEALQQQQQQQQQAAGSRGGRASKRGGWLKRWITGE
ncbi:hypothetical protein OEZ85_010211 [Tetradesmus obliquus]|uniref:CBM20 domain-containing protein n=1 Tax=Tetradesmus obliquus TaxID=3088 RepID=A0ABY8TLM6_TETOB|nr:hypothetical protein OEZ85_010211 [Tetradesmus obliquus]